MKQLFILADSLALPKDTFRSNQAETDVDSFSQELEKGLREKLIA
jgi:hypothetical protein